MSIVDTPLNNLAEKYIDAGSYTSPEYYYKAMSEFRANITAYTDRKIKESQEHDLKVIARTTTIEAANSYALKRLSEISTSNTINNNKENVI